jgi:hypothetical protein
MWLSVSSAFAGSPEPDEAVSCARRPRRHVGAEGNPFVTMRVQDAVPGDAEAKETTFDALAVDAPERKRCGQRSAMMAVWPLSVRKITIRLPSSCREIGPLEFARQGSDIPSSDIPCIAKISHVQRARSRSNFSTLAATTLHSACANTKYRSYSAPRLAMLLSTANS